MQDEDFSQHNTVPKTSETQRINGADYDEKMKERYEKFVQHETVAKVQEVSIAKHIEKVQEVSIATPTEDSPHLRELPPLVLQAQRILERTPVAVVVVVVVVVTLFVHGYRLSATPDVFSDEATYLLVGINVARGMGFTVDHQVFFYHPPAYFLIEAAYIKLAGLTNTDVLTALFSVRYLNIFFSATTASFLLLFGRKLHSYKAGLIMVALFLMDSYVQRINRRNMIETFAMLCLLLGFYTFFTHRQRLIKWQWLGSGIAFGLATLTKEPMFIPLFALLGIVAWTRRTQLPDAVRVIAIACLLYLSYPSGEIAVGEGPNYFAFKLTQVERVVQSITGYGLIATSQKTLSTQNLWSLLGQYATSYLLLALSGISIIILFLRFRHLMEARYLVAWSVFNFGYFIILGRISDQYFYFLIVPNAIIVNGYILATFFEAVQYHRWLAIVLSLFLCLLLLYNSSMWITRDVYGSDDGYAKIITYIEAHILPGETIDASDDVSYYLLSPAYDIRLDRDKGVIIERHEHYFIMSSKDRWGGYDATTPEFYDWIVHNSQPLVVEQEDSFWTIGLYYLKEPGTTSTPNSPTTPSVTMSRSYPGTFYDIPNGPEDDIPLTNIRQLQWNISGYFDGMPESRPFRGNTARCQRKEIIIT